MKRLVFLFSTGAMLLLLTWHITHPVKRAVMPNTNGPVALFVSGPINTTKDLTWAQLEALQRQLPQSASNQLPGLSELFMIQITNRGTQSLELLGFNSSSPLYQIYFDGTNGLDRLKPNRLGDRLTTFRFNPAQSMLFPIIRPDTDRPWHVAVSYREFVPLATAIPVAPTPIQNLIGRIRSFVPFLANPEPQSYFAMSEPAIDPNRRK